MVLRESESFDWMIIPQCGVFQQKRTKQTFKFQTADGTDGVANQYQY
jgi:hypothetical protein